MPQGQCDGLGTVRYPDGSCTIWDPDVRKYKAKWAQPQNGLRDWLRNGEDDKISYFLTRREAELCLGENDQGPTDAWVGKPLPSLLNQFGVEVFRKAVTHDLQLAVYSDGDDFNCVRFFTTSAVGGWGAELDFQSVPIRVALTWLFDETLRGLAKHHSGE